MPRLRVAVASLAVLALAGCSEVVEVMGANPCDDDAVVETFDEVFGQQPLSIEEADATANEFLDGFSDAARADYHVTTALGPGEVAEIGSFCCVPRGEDTMLIVVREAEFLQLVNLAELRENDTTFVLPAAVCLGG